MNTKIEFRPAAEEARPVRLKKILVPVEDADCSRKALKYAIAFAKQFHGSITLLNALRIDYVGTELPIDYALLERGLRDSGGKLLEDFIVNDVRGQVPCDVMMEIGSAGGTIVEAAKKLEADLIIISTHGRTGLRHLLLGSTTEYVIRHAPCPVLTVRKHEHDFISD